MKTFQVTFSVLVDYSEWMVLCRDANGVTGNEAVTIARKELRKYGAIDDDGYLIAPRRIGECRILDILRIDGRPEYDDPNRIPDPRENPSPMRQIPGSQRRIPKQVANGVAVS